MTPNAPPDPTEVVSGLDIGGFFADRYRVDAVLGIGSMGKVLLATDMLNNAEVAIKVLHSEMAVKEDVLARFRREADILRQLGHPGIVQVYNSGRTRDGVDYIVMERLRGQTLKAKIAKDGPMHPQQVLHLLEPICRALSAAHDKGVVHRDLKPENIFLSQGDPPIRIVDFGLSVFENAHRMTKPGTMLGTPKYMSPEQIRSALDADARTDTYALGIIVYEMLTGKSPFPAEDPAQLLGCIISGRVRPIEELRPDLSYRVGQAIRRAMAFDREERFTAVGAFAEMFASALGITAGENILSPGQLEELFAEPTPAPQVQQQALAAAQNARAPAAAPAPASYNNPGFSGKSATVESSESDAKKRRLILLSIAAVITFVVIVGCGIMGYGLRVAMHEGLVPDPVHPASSTSE